MVVNFAKRMEIAVVKTYYQKEEEHGDIRVGSTEFCEYDLI